MADRILLQGIEFYGFHGVPAAERETGRRYRVDAVLELDLRPAGRSDDLALTADYGRAASLIVELGTGPGVQLLETLAERMAERLLQELPLLEAVEIQVTKLHPPIPLVVAASAVRIRRTRSEFNAASQFELPAP